MQANDSNTKGNEMTWSLINTETNDLLKDINGNLIETHSQEAAEKWAEAMRNDGHPVAAQYLG